MSKYFLKRDQTFQVSFSYIIICSSFTYILLPIIPKEYKESCFPKRSMLFCRGVFGALMNSKHAAVNKHGLKNIDGITYYFKCTNVKTSSANEMQLYPVFPYIYCVKTNNSVPFLRRIQEDSRKLQLNEKFI